MRRENSHGAAAGREQPPPLRVNLLCGLKSPTRYALDFYYSRPEVAQEVRRAVKARRPRFVIIKPGSVPRVPVPTEPALGPQQGVEQAAQPERANASDLRGVYCA